MGVFFLVETPAGSWWLRLLGVENDGWLTLEAWLGVLDVTYCLDC